jgi:O-antigen biosynthesis protein
LNSVEHEKTICLVIGDLGGPGSSNSIRTYYVQIARLLSRNGWKVIVLSDNVVGENDFKENGIGVYNAQDLYRESAKSLDDVWRDSNWHQARSHIFDEALQVLMNKYRCKFDLVEFPDKGACGFIPIRAKYSRTGDDTRFIVRLHSPGQWHRDNLLLESVSVDDLKLDYMERYAFENADIRVSSTQYLVKWARENGWKLSSEVSVCPNFVMGLNKFKSQAVIPKPDHIVFFGRCEVGKPINEFINAMNHIAGNSVTFPEQYKVTFLGNEGLQSTNYVRESLPNFEVNFLNLSREEEIKFLIEHARLVVASLGEGNYPETVMECIDSRIPFITSREGANPEILGVGSDLYESISCDTSKPEILGSCILRYLSYDREHLHDLLESAYQRLSSIADPELIVSWYNNRLMENTPHYQRKTRLKKDPPVQEASVTLIIPFYNMQRYILSTLEAIHQQTYRNFKIICVNDGSTNPDAILMLDYIRQRYPEIIILDKQNGGPGSALNFALPHVESKYIIEVDADNLVRPHMLKTFVNNMENRGEVAGLSCYMAAFLDKDEKQVTECLSASKEYTSGTYYYKPLGPCLPILFFENCAGDANSIYSTLALKAIGGWPETREGVQDWGLWIKLLANGYVLDVVPEVLFYYRQHNVSELKTKTQFGLDKANMGLIRSLILKNANLFTTSCYEGLHKLVRGSNTQSKDVKIKDLESQIDQVQNNLGFQLTRIQDMESQIDQTQRARELQLIRIKDLESQLYQLQDGLAMQLVTRYQRVINKLLPSGTRRRNIYLFGLSGARVILNEGLKGFCRKAIIYIKKRHKKRK